MLLKSDTKIHRKIKYINAARNCRSWAYPRFTIWDGRSRGAENVGGRGMRKSSPFQKLKRKVRKYKKGLVD